MNQPITKGNPAKLVIVGAGGHGKVVADAAHACGNWETLALVDDADEEFNSIFPWPLKGTIKAFQQSEPDPETRFVPGIGNNETRVRISERLIKKGHQIALIVHPTATTSQYCSIGDGTVIMAGATINIDAIIGPMSILNTNCTVEHDCTLGKGVHISPGAHITGGVSIGSYSWIGTGAIVVNQATIGKRCIVGAGSLVLKSVPDDTIVVGTPARPIDRHT